jgi:KaiC/GvpD/RAD55 family RecA-like ATPase
MAQEELLGTLEYPELDPVLNTYGEVEAHRTVFDGLNSKISFVGYDLEQKATGLHGIIEVYLDSTQVAWDNINYTKATQRKAVAGDAYSDGDLDFVAKFYPRKHMHKDLAVFAKKAYPIYLGKVEVDMVYGDPMLEIREYIKGLIPMGTGVIVNSRPGMGKSWIVMLIAVTVDSGSTTLWNAEQGNVLYINLERSESSMRRRLGGVNTSLGLDYNRPLRFLNVRGRSLVDIRDSVKKIVEKEDIKLIVVDSISRAGMGSLIEDNVAMRITDLLNNLVEETDRAWLGIAHRGHTNQNVFGSIHFIAAADVVVKLESARNLSKQLGIKLTVEKQNDLPPTMPTLVGLSFDSMGINNVWRPYEYEFPDLIEEDESTK